MSRQSRHEVDKRIDRQVAAEILSISQRTLDRYIKTKRLYSRKAAGRIWLDEEDVRLFKKAREQGALEGLARQHQGIKSDENHGVINIDTSRQSGQGVSTLTSMENLISELVHGSVEKVLHNDKIEENGVSRLEQYAPTQSFPQQFTYYYSEGIYQKLYEELKEEHGRNQKRIEAANYKVGQLEAQVASMVPMLEYRKQKESFRRLELGLKTQVEKREIQLKKARRLLQSEQLNKWAFGIIAVTLIVLQPVLWLMQR